MVYYTLWLLVNYGTMVHHGTMVRYKNFPQIWQPPGLLKCLLCRTFRVRYGMLGLTFNTMSLRYIMEFSTACYGMVQHGTVWYGTVWYGTGWSGTVRYATTVPGADSSR